MVTIQFISDIRCFIEIARSYMGKCCNSNALLREESSWLCNWLPTLHILVVINIQKWLPPQSEKRIVFHVDAEILRGMFFDKNG